MHIKVQKAEYVGRFRRPVMADVSHLFKSLFFIDISKILDIILSKDNKFFHDPTGNFYIEEKKTNNIKCTWINENNTQEKLYFTRLGFCVWFTSNFKLGDKFIIHKKTGKGKFYKLKNYALIKRYKGLEGADKLFGEQNEQKWFSLRENDSEWEKVERINRVFTVSVTMTDLKSGEKEIKEISENLKDLFPNIEKITAHYYIRKNLRHIPPKQEYKEYVYEEVARARFPVKCPVYDKDTCGTHCVFMSKFTQDSFYCTLQCKCGATFLYLPEQAKKRLVFDQEPNEKELCDKFLEIFYEFDKYGVKEIENPFTVEYNVETEKTDKTVKTANFSTFITSDPQFFATFH